MVKIAIIETNKCAFTDLKSYVVDLLYKEYNRDEYTKIKNDIDTYIWTLIEPYIKFMDISDSVVNDDTVFLETMCNILTEKFDKPLNQFYYHTESSFSFPKKYIEIVHSEPLWSEYKALEKDNINNIGCYLSFEQKIIENRFIALSYKYNENSYSLNIDDITKHDIIRTIKRRHIFSALLIKDNSSIIKYYYNNKNYLIQMLYGCKPFTESKMTILNYNLALYSSKEKDYVNKFATRLNGTKTMYGDVLVFHEFEEGVPANLSLNELNRLNLLSYGRLCDRKLKQDEVARDDIVENDGNVEKKNSIKSRYTVVDNRIKKIKSEDYPLLNKCITCGKSDAKFICNKCFRVKYCCLSCCNDYTTYHNDDCIKHSDI